MWIIVGLVLTHICDVSPDSLALSLSLSLSLLLSLPLSLSLSLSLSRFILIYFLFYFFLKIPFSLIFPSTPPFSQDKLKLAKGQIRRVYEILRFKALTKGNDAELRAFRLMVKKRLYQPYAVRW